MHIGIMDNYVGRISQEGSMAGSAAVGAAPPPRVWLIALGPAVLTATMLIALWFYPRCCRGGGVATTSQQRDQGLLRTQGSWPNDSRGGGLFGAFRSHSARMLLLCCFAYMISYNSFMFLAAWLVQHITGSAWLVQVSGFFFMAPMLAGPVLGKAADRISKHTLEAIALSTVTATSITITVALTMHWPDDIAGSAVMDGRGTARTFWLSIIYAHAAVVGFGMPVFQCTHLPRIKAAVGNDAASAANAAAMSCFGAGSLIASQLGGLTVQHLGVVGAYIVASGWTLLTLVLLFTATEAPTKRTHNGRRQQEQEPQLNDGLADVSAPQRTATGEVDSATSVWVLLHNRAYAGVLGVTVLANLLFWGHIPFVQVLAARLGCTPTQAGILSSATGAGSLLGCVLVAALNPQRIGRVFCLGMGCASAMLAIAAADNYVCCLVGLFSANTCGGCFAATQATLAMQAVPRDAHGLGMGTLALAIGAQAAGMLIIGALSEQVGPTLTMLLLAGVGTSAQLGFSLAMPECSRMVRDDK